MRIVSLDPSLSETLVAFGLESSLVATSHDSDFPESIRGLPRVTSATELGRSRSPFLQRSLARDHVFVDQLLSLDPDTIVTILPDADILLKLREELSAQLGHEVNLRIYSPTTFETVLDMFERLARDLKVPEKGKLLSHRLKAQAMDWSDNFYSRMKNKKVTFITSLDPLRIAGRWIPDMIRLCSAIPQPGGTLEEHAVTRWEDIVAYNPDVLVVCPEHLPLEESKRGFLTLEKLPRWGEINAVKRGEVVFTDGLAFFHRASPRLVDSMGVLVSAIAGLESGYITPRDVFFRLRYLELHRHKI